MPPMPTAVQPLSAWFACLDRAVVCLSGGVDSSVLAAAAAGALGERALAVTGLSPSLAERDRAACEDLCARLGMAWLGVATHELDRLDYAANPVDRCYFCKSELFERVTGALPHAFLGAAICEGTHCDDLAGHRPGRRAGQERAVRSPFVELGWGKLQVVAAARALDLPDSVVQRPSSPCLASRLPFGTPVTPERLSAVERAERELHRRGYLQCRVRHHDLVARIELPRADVARFLERDGAEVAAAFKALGFVYTTVDVLGLRSGSLLEAVRNGAR